MPLVRARILLMPRPQGHLKFCSYSIRPCYYHKNMDFMHVGNVRDRGNIFHFLPYSLTKVYIGKVM